MNKFEKQIETKDLIPITHKEFNEFIKGKGFKGRNNYKLKELKAMFGFRPMVIGSQITISLDDGEPTVHDTISKASTSTGIPYSTLLYAKKKSKSMNPVIVKSSGKKCVIKFNAI